jgi:hypothetical protein
VTSSRAALEPAPSGRLDDRVLETLEDSRGRIAFSGLRRLLRAHPESLSRALHRLERAGQIARTDGGYRSLSEGPRRVEAERDGRRAIARVDLPPGVSAPEVVRRLAGRWFGRLRWVGDRADRDERLLEWARPDGGARVFLGVEASTLQVYVRDAAFRGDPRATENAAYELLYHAVQALRPDPEERSIGVALFTLRDPERPGPVEN